MDLPSAEKLSRMPLRWFDVRRRQLGMFAYVINRLTAIGLVVYLYLHLAVLSLLAGGPSMWDPFIALVRSPFFLFLDLVLLAGLLIHGLNGLRILVTSLGFGVGAHKQLYVGLMVIAAVILVVGAILIFTQ